jgi:hypothetical protein
MLRELWDRLLGRGRHVPNRDDMSPEEREFREESVDELEADQFAGEVLGGIDPDRLLGNGAPPREDHPPS